MDTHSKIFVHRLHVWRLWPYLFKRDISVLAHHAMQQPSGSVKAELQSCGAFSTMVASLALAPDLLAKARHLLHSWFLSVNRYSHQLHFPPTGAKKKLTLLLSSSEDQLGTSSPVKLSILISLQRSRKDDSIVTEDCLLVKFTVGPWVVACLFLAEGSGL